MLNVPGGILPGGLRLGVTFLGEAWSEGPLIRLGYAFELARDRTSPPGRRPVDPLWG